MNALGIPLPSTPPTPGDRSWFPDLEARAYLAHAGISPPSVAVRRVALQVIDDYARVGLSAIHHWIPQRERLRASLATLIGAAPRDIGLVPSTTRGLTDLALCIDWRPGDRVLLFRGEFPANVTPWQQAARTFGLELVWRNVSDLVDRFEEIERTLRGGVRLVAVSAVQFQTGHRMPLDRLGALCRAHGAELAVDGIQAAGVVPLDAAHFDYLSVGSHKWLMGLEGCGFIYVSPDRVGSLVPRTAGWLSHEDPVGFLFMGAGHLRYDKPVRASASFVEGSAQNAVGFAALEAALAPILAIGVDAIYAHVQRYHDALEPGLEELGLQSHRHPRARSGSLSFTLPAGVDLGRFNAALGERGISASTPDGHLRFSPHWPNHTDEVPAVVDAVRAALGRP